VKGRGAILAGDIADQYPSGDYGYREGTLPFLTEETFSSREEPSLESALRKFLSNPTHPITRACLGVAGPCAMVAVRHQLAW